jgi:GTP:adenosylcobinamide-phosphate guanylyltransferase
MIDKMSAVVLAGGKASEEIQKLTGVTNRALVPIGGRPMLDYVVDALHASDTVDDVYVVGDVPSSSRYTQIADQGSLLDNLMAGLNAAGTESALVATSDIPFITAAAIDDFVTQASARKVDIAYPIVEMGAYRQRFGDMKRTTVRLREGEFTGGNVMLLRTEFVTRQPEHIRQAYAARKDVLKLGMLLGPGLLVRLIVSQAIAPSVLSLPMIESAAARVLGEGTKVAAVITRFPEIGTDVDKPEDIAAAEKILCVQAPLR